MTDVRAPETDSFDPAAELQDQPRPGPSSPGAAFGPADWLKWAWRQLTSMRIALILLFLLALGSVPGSMLPQQGGNPSAVQQYFTSHPDLAPWLNRLGLFNVFAAPWFAAIYLLLFASLVGCVVPRTFRLAGSARTLPPRAPRHLARLPRSAEYTTALPPQEAVEVAARVLSGRGFRLRRPDDADTAQDWVSAEKGYLREAGNLLFHLALLGVLVSVALGGLFGYKADRLLVQGQSFADTVSALDEFHPGRFVTAADLGPFTMTLNRFDASYIASGEQRGQPSAFDARVTYTEHPGGPARTFDLEVNRPLSVDGAKVYLIGHGYAPEFTVTDARGHVVYKQATPFVAGASGNFLSEGVVKVPDAQPEQLGFTGVFVPTAVNVGGTLESVFPAADNPMVSLIAYAGNLGEDSGPLAVRLRTRYHRHAPADDQPAGAPAGPVAEAAERPGHGHVHRLRPLGEPGHHARPGPAARPDLRHRRPGRAAALVHDPPSAGLRPCPHRPFGPGSTGRHHGAGRRTGPDRRGRRLRGGIRHAGRRAEVRARAGRPGPVGPADPASTAPAASTTTTRGRVSGMTVNVALGHVSNAFMIAALVIYSLSVVAFAGDFAFGRPRRAAAAASGQAQDRAAALASVGAASAAGATADQAPAPATAAATATAGGEPADDAGTMPELAGPALRAIREAGRWVVAAVAFAAFGAAAHTTAVITRGLAVHRAPWGNMYEFVTALTCVAAIFFLFAMIRYRAWTLGVFVMGAVVVTLGLAETLIYTAPGDLVPALQSYWLDIHVTAMTLATGIFFVPAVLGFVYLWVDRYTRRVAAGRAAPGNGIVRRLPSIEQLDRLTYRTIVFGFPVWTFGVIAGAIWADQAWGRYWGWDPVETWAFITWVLYAAFLHARATAGWRGRRAHYVQLLGFASLIFNILVVQVFIAGMHSYSGVS